MHRPIIYIIWLTSLNIALSLSAHAKIRIISRMNMDAPKLCAVVCAIHANNLHAIVLLPCFSSKFRIGSSAFFLPSPILITGCQPSILSKVMTVSCICSQISVCVSAWNTIPLLLITIISSLTENISLSLILSLIMIRSIFLLSLIIHVSLISEFSFILTFSCLRRNL